MGYFLHKQAEKAQARCADSTVPLLVGLFRFSSNQSEKYNARIQRWGQGVRVISPENQKAIEFLCKTGPDPLKNHKATRPAFNVRPSSVRQRNGPMMTCSVLVVIKTFWSRA